MSGNTVVLTWTAPSSPIVANYVIEAGSAPGLSNLAVSSTSGTQTSAAFSGVPFGIYYVRVRARNALGIGNASNEVTVPVICPLPAAPINLTVMQSGASVTFTWQPSVGENVISYVIVVGNAPGASNLLVSNVGPATSLSATGPPGSYYVSVLARNACGNSGGSNEVVVSIP